MPKMRSVAPSANGHSSAGPTSSTPEDKDTSVSDTPLEEFDYPHLIERIQNDLALLGIAGEKENVISLYLVGTSRLQEDTLSALVMGDSSSGKSHLINTVAGCFPPECLKIVTRGTPQWLYHLEESISHKFLVGGERSRVQDDEAADQTAALRQLRSEGTIVKQFVGKDSRTHEAVVKGPIAFVESTTLKKAIIFAEDLNRGLILKTNATPEQNRAAIREMAKRYSTKVVDKIDRQAIHDKHHAFQRSLKALDVRLPYVENLSEEIPVGETQSRRVFAQLMAVIETIAILHQHKRARDSEGRLLATKADYELARSLLLGPLREAIGEETREAYAKLRLLKCSEFDSTQALKAFLSKPTRDKYLNILVGYGVLVCTKKASGPLPARWKWTGKSLDDLVLPSAEKVCESVSTPQLGSVKA